MDLLLHIETTVHNICKENSNIIDKDIEFVYDKLERYFKTLSTGKSVDEPSSTFEVRETLIDSILDILDEREEEEVDAYIIQSYDYLHDSKTIPSINYLYMIALKKLAKSVKFWRKRNGKKGYISYIEEFLKKMEEEED